MGSFYPKGGACKCLAHGTDGGCAAFATRTGFTGTRAFCMEYEDPSFSVGIYVVWFDFVAFLCCVLVCPAPQAVKKWALSWHMVYMMAFLSFQGFHASHAVTLTTMLGAGLSLIIVLVPSYDPDKPCCLTCSSVVANKLEEHPMKLQETLKQVLNDSIELMTEQPMRRGSTYTAKGFKIESAIGSISTQFATMVKDYYDSWWEGWLFLFWRRSWFRQARWSCGLYVQFFDEQVGGLDDALHILKKSVVFETAALYDDPDQDEDIASIREFRSGVERETQKLADAIQNYSTPSTQRTSSILRRGIMCGDVSMTCRRSLPPQEAKCATITDACKT
ncbi:unnamed protein product [Prorocentrum cordatum]|uniref:Uncharacterized protein n=1 Tax=Prorocentrum cordatum TaxID=2364126 RepID=A0ABN9WAW1_9DINO|nr:unnamed protein product [Polarella glacialis]